MNRDLLGIIHCLGPNYPVQLSFYDLLVFGLGVFMLTSILIGLYSCISTKKMFINEKALYNSKDILLQGKNEETNYLIIDQPISIIGRFIIYTLILITIFTPLYKLLGIEHFL